MGDQLLPPGPLLRQQLVGTLVDPARPQDDGRHPWQDGGLPFRLDEYDQAFTTFTWEVVQAVAIARSPLLAQMGPPERSGTTVGSRIEALDGTSVDLPGAQLGFEFTTDLAAVRDGDASAYVTQVDLAADALKDAMLKHVFETLGKVTEATGNVVSAAGKPPFEAIYEMLDKIEWSLDDDDQLSFPTLVGGPGAIAKLGEVDAEQRRMLDELLRRKHEGLLARKRRRLLS